MNKMMRDDSIHKHLSDPDYTVVIDRENSHIPSAYFYYNADPRKSGFIELRLEGRTDGQIVEEAEAIYLMRGFDK